MDLRHLRSFAAVADTLNFTEASLRVSLSQPALSRQILDLEHELGLRLFDRLGRRVVLTTDGEALLPYCFTLLKHADSFAERARALAGGKSGQLRIGADPYTMGSFLPSVLTRFTHSYKGVDVTLIQEGGEALLALLARGSIHLALARHPDGDSLAAIPLFPVRLLAVVSSSHPLKSRRALEVSEIAKEDLLISPRGFTSRELFEDACSEVNIKPRAVLESGAHHTLIPIAQARLGIAVVPSMVPVQRGVRAIPLLHNGRPMGVWMSIIWDPRRFLTLAAKKFIEQIRAHSRRSYPGKRLRLTAPPIPRPSTYQHSV